RAARSTRSRRGGGRRGGGIGPWSASSGWNVVVVRSGRGARQVRGRGRRVRLRGLRLVLEEGVGQRQRVDVRRQVRVDDEAYRHVARLAGLQRLRGEAEAFGLG